MKKNQETTKEKLKSLKKSLKKEGRIQVIRFDVRLGYPTDNHIYSVYLNTDKYVENILLLKKAHQKEGINLVFTGTSGAIISALVYAELKRRDDNMLLMTTNIRKEKEDSHDRDKIHVSSPLILNVFVDDFISTGKTFERVYDKYPFDCAVVGRSNCKLWTHFSRHDIYVSLLELNKEESRRLLTIKIR